jgi:hypothetical protein
MKKPLLKRWYTWVIGIVLLLGIGAALLTDEEPAEPANTLNLDGMQLYEPADEPEPTPAPTAPLDEPELDPTPTPITITEPELTPELAPIMPTATSPDERIVYMTSGGGRYHNSGCQHLTDSATQTTIASAKAQGRTPCNTCNPPG